MDLRGAKVQHHEKVTMELACAERIPREDTNTDCSLCDSPMKTQDHIFYLCSYSTLIWDCIKKKNQSIIHDDRRIPVELMKATHSRTSGSIYVLRRGLVWTITAVGTWGIWMECNRRVHEGRATQSEEIDRRIVKDVFKFFLATRY